MNSKKHLFRRIISFMLSLVLLMGSLSGMSLSVYAEEVTPVKVACVGDSLTSGYLSSGGNKSDTAYPAYLQSLLGSGYDVENFGIPSYTLMKGTDKSYWNTQEFTNSKTFAPDIVLIMLGTNDSKSGYWNNGSLGEAKFREDAVALVNEYKSLASEPEVIFAVSPACFVEDTADTVGKITATSVETMKMVQEELIAENNWNYIDMYAKTVNQQNWYHSDGVHFTDAGYRYLAACMYEKIVGTDKQAAPTDGLIAYYDFEDVTGTAVPNKADASSYSGTLHGTNVTVKADTELGKSLNFVDGTEGYMSIPQIVNTGANSYSISMWYKFDTSFSRGGENVVLLQQNGNGRSVLLLNSANKYQTYINQQNVVGDTAVNLEEWQHVTFVYDSENQKVKYYVNGVLDCEKSAGSNEVDALTDLYIGRHKNGGSAPMSMRGNVDEIRVYDRVITNTEAKAIYDDKAGAVVSADLQALIAEAEALYQSGNLAATDEKAAALKEKLDAAKALTAESTLEEVQAAMSALQGAMDTYKEAKGITLTINTSVKERSIDRSIFGINHRYAFNGYGSFDSETMKIKDEFKELYEEAGFGSIRYPGGTISNLFNWKATIGPKENRKNQIHGFYNNSGQKGIAPNFGIGEIADFANEVNSEIVYVYSLGRGNAQDAADLIEYLNAEVGTNPNGGIDWAAVRSENGHPESYNVRYFEIGNEMQQAYGVSADGTTSQGYWLNSVSAGAEAAYIDGGIASFTKQYAVDEEDWNAVASRSDGSANLVRYMRYANTNPKKYADDGKTIVDDETFVAVEKDSVAVYVGTDAAAWTIVESFENSGANDKHVVIDYSTGAIKFGDGVNGAIPANGQQIYVSYRVDRDGFIDISKAMKETTAAINEANAAAGVTATHTANVYSSYETSGFVTKMSSRNANEWYDGLTIHPYSGAVNGSGDEGWYDAAMSLIQGTVNRVQELVNMMPENKVPVISEYGIFRSTDARVRSLTHALYIAKTLMEYVDLGSPYIQKHCLIDWYSSGADSLGPTQQAVIQAVAQNGANTTTGEGEFRFFSTPSAHVFQMLNSEGFGNAIVSAEFDTEETMYGTDAYSAMVGTDDEGNIYAAIVNLDRENAKTINVAITDGEVVQDLTGKKISIQTLDAAINAENTLENPNNVAIQKNEYISEASGLTLTLPAHAFMVVRIIEESTEPPVDPEPPVHTHTWSAWTTKSEATVFVAKTEVRKCSECGEEETRTVGTKLKATITTNAKSNKITLKKNQKSTGFKITGLAKGDSIVSIKSSNSKVVKISSVKKAKGTCTLKAGKQTGKKGKATITITLASGLKKTIKVTVQNAKVKTTKITGLEKRMTLDKGKKQTLKPVLVPFTSQDKVKFTSSKKSVVTVSSKGRIKAKKKGGATIIVKAGKKTAKVKVTVK